MKEQMERKNERTKKGDGSDNASNRGMGEGKPTKAAIRHGSTTQAGSDSGQGSFALGRFNNAQGSESNEGANYANEAGWNNEALRRKDIKGKKKPKGTDSEK